MDDIREALERELPEGERREILHLAERLEQDRPSPRPAFRGDLRRRLATPSRRWVRLGALSASCAGFGALLIGVAAIGLVGIGPFAA